MAATNSTSRRLAACAVAIGCVAAAQATGAQAPPPDGTTVESFRIEPARPAVGEDVTLVVRARDPRLPIRGLEVDTGETAGRRGGTACQTGPASRGTPFAGGAVTLRATFRFRSAGPHTLRFRARSGGCGGIRREVEAEIEVTVAPAALPVGTFAAQAPLCSHADTRVTASNTADVRAAALCLVNGERTRRKLPALRSNARLARAAARHTQDMVRRRFFDHEGPKGPSFALRIERVGFEGRAGENIGYEAGSSVTARSLVRGWMESPPHRANVVSRRFRLAGMGVSARVPVNPEEPGSTLTGAFGVSRR